MNKDQIIVEMYQSHIILRYCKAITPEYDELKSQLIIQLINMPDHKVMAAKQNGYLEYLCFVICKRIVAGRVKDSGMFYLAKNHLSLEEGYGADVTIEEEGNDYLEKVEDIVNNIHWYSKTLFKLHYKDGYKLREISEMTGINLKSVAYDIRKTREYIKQQLLKNGNI